MTLTICELLGVEREINVHGPAACTASMRRANWACTAAVPGEARLSKNQASSTRGATSKGQRPVKQLPARDHHAERAPQRAGH